MKTKGAVGIWGTPCSVSPKPTQKRRYALAAVFIAFASISMECSAQPTANVKVVNTPLPVTVANPATSLGVTVSNPAVRFSKPLVMQAFGDTIVPMDAVPPGKKFIVAYMNMLGQSNISGSPITDAGCQIRLLTGSSDTLFGALPMRVDLAGASGSEAMFLPLSPGEGLAMLCFVTGPTREQVSWFGTVGGYFVPSP
jgi:hypothetical protein